MSTMTIKSKKNTIYRGHRATYFQVFEGETFIAEGFAPGYDATDAACCASYWGD
ncbi:hypothetical protein [Chromobacterium haemolyticum]|uniref:hypothetical protein n=1 Tax=Chromobacterium haemolyticum TaxID=394935 RepID=UPI0015C418B8|nr:hypothetical protein [Chromobacterium haemolyticum]